MGSLEGGTDGLVSGPAAAGPGPDLMGSGSRPGSGGVVLTGLEMGLVSEALPSFRMLL